MIEQYVELAKYAVTLVFIGILYMITLNRVMEEVKKIRIIKEKQMLFLSFNDDNIAIIDQIINDNIVKYRVYNIDHNNTFYMSTTEQQKMIKEVLESTLESLSPVLMEKLSLMYNEKKLEDLIYSKILMAVLSLTVEINGTYKEK